MAYLVPATTFQKACALTARVFFYPETAICKGPVAASRLVLYTVTMRVSILLGLILVLMTFGGCKTLETARSTDDLQLKQELRADWSQRWPDVEPSIPWSYRSGLLPDSYKSSACRESGEMKALVIESVGSYFSPYEREIEAFVCQSETRYWVKAYERDGGYAIEDWFGPFPLP